MPFDQNLESPSHDQINNPPARVSMAADKPKADLPVKTCLAEGTQASRTLELSTPPLLAYFGQHKSGSNWIHQIMRDVFVKMKLTYKRISDNTGIESNLNEWHRRTNIQSMSWVKADWRCVKLCNVRGFHVVRDPRDILVSGYFSHLKTHPTENWPKLKSFRKQLLSLSKSEGLTLEFDFMHKLWDRMSCWPVLHPDVLTVRLEDFGEQYIERFHSIFQFLGLFDLGLTERHFASIMEANSFKKRSGGREIGQEDTSSHYRKGIHGDWRNHLNDEHIELVKERLNHLLIKYEYESTVDWN